ncbi:MULTISPECIES: helix-turn-helix transcriptional regulator [Kitasatospora]|uniref:Transcriptional regulator with XRE-family HTH domain n=2 Tax=Kitasatospora TaxID=2063 RepID=A0ABT1J564_9ACTN|nr:helix-turn-helix transcriptional regulator [Kitasatospora paracochleata]MCP2312579.1 transcriptional regulator with XRE-family HTH domain [Kitasatospora paracochleata]
MSDAEFRRRALSSFLRARRAGVTPEQVGLAPGVRRRTPGLRREELALLAGVGVTWYTWLEQGREINPSPEVLTSLARTLRLDRAETDYLFRLAGCPPRAEEPEPGRRVPAALVRLVQAQAPSPAFLIDADWDIRTWNAPAEALLEFSRWAPGERNLGWVVFANEKNRRRTVDWERHARRTLAELRAAYGERGGDSSPAAQRLAALIHRLRASFPEADRWLDEHRVREKAGTEKELEHETVGLLRIDQVVLRAPGGFQLVVFAPRDTDTAERLRALVPEGAEHVTS